MRKNITATCIAALAFTLLAAIAHQPAHALTPKNYYLPIIHQRTILTAGSTFLGSRVVTTGPDTPSWSQYLVQGAVYEMDAFWYRIETAPGVYDWSQIDATRQALNGYTNKLIVGVKAAPAWAREWPEYVSSRPSQDYWDDYARFINLVIDRTGAWGVEIWNEPAQKCYPGILDAYGCWIPPTEEELTYWMFYEAGLNYGDMLKTVIPIIKGKHPQVKIIIGAIAGYSQGGQQSRFVQGIRSASFDGVDYISMHLYMQSDNVRDLQNAYFDRTFEATSRLFADTLLPVIISETSVRTPGYNDNRLLPSPQFLMDQDDYLRRLLETAPSHREVRTILWFTLAECGYENTDLIFNRGVGSERYKPVYCTWAAALGHPEACPEYRSPVGLTNSP